MDTFLKITFIDGKSKFNTYLQNPAGNFLNLCSQVSYCIFQQRNLPTDEVRVYWIDEDNDQIDILDQQDYEVFQLKCLRRHVCVERVKKIEDKSNGNSNSNGNNKNENNNDGSNNESGSVHLKVQCDECNAAPIVGFRYKCLECENFDLCAKCEAKCLHPNHMMIRIPSPMLGYGRAMISDFRKRAKRCGSAGPEDLLSGNCSGVGVAPSGGRRHHHRKHARSSRGPGIFANLCEMMQHLAEGGAEGVYTAGRDRPQCTATPPPTPPEERDTSSDAVPPKTPPPTPTNVNAPESPITTQRAFENKSKEATTNTSPQMHSPPRMGGSGGGGGGQSTPQLGSPLFENVQHFVDPQYMKAGIEILSNFSEMFSKMLEPVDGSSGDSTDAGTSGGGRCPFSAAAGLFHGDPSNYSQSKSQSTSTSTSTGNGANSSSFDTIANAAHKAAHDAAVKAAGAAAAAAAEASAHAAAATAAAATTTSTTTAAAQQTSQSNMNTNGSKAQENSDDVTSIHESRRVSQNEDGDWQMIDKTTPNASVHDLSGSVSSVSITSFDGATGGGGPTTSSSGAVDYAKLSHDLKQHLNIEKKNEQENVKKETSVANENVIVTPKAPLTPPPPPPKTDPSTPTSSSSSSSSSSAAAAAASAPVAPVTPLYEEKRAIPVYHKDPRINSAVLSMMSMGFSNEGGWLTQLLETVNGSISDALDEMSAAQRNRN